MQRIGAAPFLRRITPVYRWTCLRCDSRLPSSVMIRFHPFRFSCWNSFVMSFVALSLVSVFVFFIKHSIGIVLPQSARWISLFMAVRIRIPILIAILKFVITKVAYASKHYRVWSYGEISPTPHESPTIQLLCCQDTRGYFGWVLHRASHCPRPVKLEMGIQKNSMDLLCFVLTRCQRSGLLASKYKVFHGQDLLPFGELVAVVDIWGEHYWSNAIQCEFQPGAARIGRIVYAKPLSCSWKPLWEDNLEPQWQPARKVLAMPYPSAAFSLYFRNWLAQFHKSFSSSSHP